MHLYNIYIVGISELAKLQEIKDKDYDVSNQCAFRLYDPKYAKEVQGMPEYGSNDTEAEVEVVAVRKVKKGSKKKKQGKKRKRADSDSEYEPDPNYNNRKRRKIEQKHKSIKIQVCKS